MSDTYTARPDSNDMSGKDLAGKDLAGKAKELVRDVKARASDLTDGVTRAAKDNASQLGDAALDMANSAKGQGRSRGFRAQVPGRRLHRLNRTSGGTRSA